MIDAERLLADTKKQVVAMVDDLRAVAVADPDASAHVATEYQRAHTAGRTAFGQAEWAEGLYAQVAVAWVLGCVFVRFCEDNDLIEDPLLGGPGIRSQIALDHRAAHLKANPAHDDRHWLREVFGRVRALRATGDIFGGHNPVWADGLLPSADGARKLREELTRLDPESGELRHDFTDPAWDTRFLGDLYQDLSEHAKKVYALLQTPVFVEEFILDRTLEPAIATFGLADTTIIDPTCGSGHFLLGAFARLFDRWVDAEPSTNRREIARRSLNAIGGIDLNPFAVSVARFRLLVAALRAGGDKRLADAPAYEIQMAVGDSLLHGDPPGRLPGMHTPGEEEELVANHGYESEDIEEVRALLGRGWSAVVGNPPYITVKDSALNQAYRHRFGSCSGKYSLGVPFTERFWQLARRDLDGERVGFVGLITTNSFMKREMGKRLIEQWFPANDVTHVLDTSDAYIPGHGTPTVILFGRNRAPLESKVRVVMGARGEPSRPEIPEDGLVWSSIVRMLDTPGSQNDFVTVVDLDRQRLFRHPWSIGGGGAAELKELIDEVPRRLGSEADSIGFASFPGTDDAFVAPRGAHLRTGYPHTLVRDFVKGESVRDWLVECDEQAFVPYGTDFLPVQLDMDWGRVLWPVRTVIWSTTGFGGMTRREAGEPWWTWYRWVASKYRAPLSIVYASITTHNHFVLDRGGRVFKQSAPVIKLAVGSSEEQHIELLGALNCSTVCFWLKQVMHYKGAGGKGESVEAQLFQASWDIDGTKLKQLPLPRQLPFDTPKYLVELAESLAEVSPTALVGEVTPTPASIRLAAERYQSLRRLMIAAQEQLDWEFYCLYGLVEGDADVVLANALEPPLQLGERAFEIVLARRVATGQEESTWFERHGSTPITELPSHWSDDYRRVVERRIELIEGNLNISLIERPEHKRRWWTRGWESDLNSALEMWLARRLEAPRFWPRPATISTVARLTSEARLDEDFVSVARIYAGRDDVDLGAVIADLIKADSVAYLEAHRYTDSGLRKHAEWLKTWELQRHEDAGDDVGTVPAPPKYGTPDFHGNGWEHRGKLDVPKERFISYPGAERETDASMVIGWAGWNHLDRARALAAWYLQARRDGRDAAHLMPLLAGLAELVPWLKQWYDEPNADPALDRPGTQISALVDAEMRSLGLTAPDLTAWRPEKKRSGRPRKATT